MSGHIFRNFRILSELHINEDSKPLKAYLYIKGDEWSNINDVQFHIKNVFNIHSPLKLYVDNCLLPANESINLIQPTDVLVVKSHLKCNIFKSTNNSLLEECYNELSQKKNELIKDKIEESQRIVEENNSFRNDMNELTSKRKRKRKHKKKSKDSLSMHILHSQLEENCVIPVPKSSPTTKHMRFIDDEKIENIKELEVNTSMQSDDKSNKHSSELEKSAGDLQSNVSDVKSMLLSLANNAEKTMVFSRNN